MITPANKTASEILNEAADVLENEIKPWNKGAYFKKTDQGCSMCAHGAIAYCGNPKVKERVDNNITAKLLASSIAEDAIQASARLCAPDEDYIRKHFNGEIGLAHYKAAKVGLTFDYNDDPKTTKEDVISKLREEAKLTDETK